MGPIDNLRLFSLRLFYRVHIMFCFFIIPDKDYFEDPCRSAFPFISTRLWISNVSQEQNTPQHAREGRDEQLDARLFHIQVSFHLWANINKVYSWVWCHIPLIPTLGRWRQSELQDILGYIERPCVNNKDDGLFLYFFNFYYAFHSMLHSLGAGTNDHSWVIFFFHQPGKCLLSQCSPGGLDT